MPTATLRDFFCHARRILFGYYRAHSLLPEIEIFNKPRRSARKFWESHEECLSRAILLEWVFRQLWSCCTLGKWRRACHVTFVTFSIFARGEWARKQYSAVTFASPTECRNFPLFFTETLPRSRPTSMAEPPESSLPPAVLEKLRELNTELAEGEWLCDWFILFTVRVQVRPVEIWICISGIFCE